jgi:hypothetical protein
MGGVFNYVNLHTYHYAGNNPVKLTDPDGEMVRNRSDDSIVVMPEHGHELLAPKGLQREDGKGVESGNFFGRLDGVITRDGTIYKGAGGVKVTKNNDGSYNIKVTALGKMLNAVANFIKWFGNIFKVPENRDEYYGMYHKDDDTSETVRQWWPIAEAHFQEEQQNDMDESLKMDNEI